MSMPLDPDRARQLFEAGMMNPDTYEKNYGTFGGKEIAESAPETPQAMKQDPAAMFRNAAGDIKKMEIDAQKQQLEQRAQFAKKLGMQDEEIDAKIAPIKEDLDAQERGLMLTGEKPAPDNLRLTSDLQSQGAPQIGQQDMYPSAPLMASYDLQQQAVGLAGAAGAAKAYEQSSAIKTTQDEKLKLQRSQEEDRAREQQKLNDEQTKLQSEVERVSQLKVDPNKFWADRTTEDKIILGVSLFLGAFGASRTGVNQAVNVIDQAINRDIKIQEQNIAQETSGLMSKRGLLSELKSTFKDNDMARAAAKITYLQDAQMNVERIAKKYESQEVKAKAMEMIGQLEAQKQQVNAQYMTKVQSMMPVGPNANFEMLNDDQRKRFVKGYGLAQKAEYADIANKELIPETRAINDSINSLRNIAQKPASSLSPTDRATAETHVRVLIGKLRLPITGPGAMSDGERELLESLVANPTKIFSLEASNKAKLDTLQQKVNNSFQDKLDQFGLQVPEKQINFKPLN